MKKSTIQHHVQHYQFKPLQVLCEEFNKLTNTLQREEQKPTDPCSLLAEDDERRNLPGSDHCEIKWSGDFVLNPEKRVNGYIIQV